MTIPAITFRMTVTEAKLWARKLTRTAMFTPEEKKMLEGAGRRLQEAIAGAEARAAETTTAGD